MMTEFPEIEMATLLFEIFVENHPDGFGDGGRIYDGSFHNRVVREELIANFLDLIDIFPFFFL